MSGTVGAIERFAESPIFRSVSLVATVYSLRPSRGTWRGLSRCPVEPRDRPWCGDEATQAAGRSRSAACVVRGT